MMKSGARWILVGSLVSILMMGGLGLAMGKKVEKEETTAQAEVEQKQIEGEQKGNGKVEKAGVKPGGKPEKEEKKEELKLELIWEREFDQITEVGFVPSPGLLEGAKKAPGATLASGFPIGAVVTDYGKKVTFFNQKGEIESEIKLAENQMATISPNGEYVAIKTWDKKRYVTITELKDKLGHTLWKKENYPGLILSSTGEAVGINGMQSGDEVIGIAGLCFYDKTGDLIKKVEISLRWGEVSLSEDGSLLAAQGTDKVVAFNNKGEELWRYEIDNLDTDKIVVSPKGNYIVASYSDWKTHKNRLFFFNKQGKLVRAFDTILGDLAMEFSLEEKYLGVGDYHNLYFFVTETGELLWKYHEKIAPLYFRSVSIASQEGYIAAGVCTRAGRQFDQERERLNLPLGTTFIYLFTHKGQLIMKEKVNNIDLKISPDGEEIIAIGGKSVSYFKLR